MSKSTNSSESFFLANNALNHKETAIKASEEYVKNNQTPSTNIDIVELRAQIMNLVKEQKFGEAIRTLERLRDAKCGINTHAQEGNPFILIRDARACKSEPHRGTEAFEMQYLNIIRAAKDIASIEGKNEILSSLDNKAIEFINNFHQRHLGINEAKLSKLLREEVKTLANSLQQEGIKGALKKINIAKDYQNFKDQQHNIVTLSSVKNFTGKETYTAIEVEIGMRGLTEAQKQEYQKVIKSVKEQPLWFQALNKTEQSLVKSNAATILAGSHLIPTQLTRIPGMRNSFEKITGIMQYGKFEIIHTAKHAGTLALLNNKVKESELQRITDENSRQAQAWLGNKILHCNTFNSGPIGAGEDPNIVRRTRQAMKNVGGQFTNTAFNVAKRLGGLASDLTGAKEYLNILVNNIGVHPEVQKDLATHLQPRSFLKRTFGIGKPKNNFNELLDKLSPTAQEVAKHAFRLKDNLEKADIPLKMDKENTSLAVSTELNNLVQIVTHAKGKGSFQSMPEFEILNMCKSGKDRTGLAMFDQSSQAIADRVHGNLDEIDKALVAAGHTAQQSGGIYSGGASVGCMGTKSENKAGIPQSRYTNVSGIMEASAKTSKFTISFKEKISQFFSTASSQSKFTGSQIVNSASINTEMTDEVIQRGEKIKKNLVRATPSLTPQATPTPRVPYTKKVSSKQL